MSTQMSVYQWLDTAVSGIRFKPDRIAVRKELEAHLEDRTAGLQRSFPGISDEDARDLALSGMGDPEELKRSLAKIHRPWPGYLWRASQALAAVTLTLALLLCGGGALHQRLDQPNDPVQADRTECYQSGIDPWNGTGDSLRTPLAVLRPGEQVRVRGYRLRIARAGLFHFQDSAQDPGDWWLFCDLRAAGLPWEPLDDLALWHVRAVDSAGNVYPGAWEVYEERVDHAGYVMVNSGGVRGLEKKFNLEISRIPPDTQWVRLEYDRMGVQWSLTVPLEVEHE